MRKWQFKWFGFWSEFGLGYLGCPSWKEFVDVDNDNSLARDKILKYLGNGTLVCVTTVRYSLEKDGDPGISRSMAILTDGEWTWPDNLIDFICRKNIQVPNEFIEHMKCHSFICPVPKNTDMKNLSWPN